MKISQEKCLKTDVLGRSCNSILIPGGLAGRDHISLINSVVGAAQWDGLGESSLQTPNSVTCSTSSSPREAAVFQGCIPAGWEAAAEQPHLRAAVWMPAVSSSLLLDRRFIIDLLLQYSWQQNPSVSCNIVLCPAWKVVEIGCMNY